MNSYKLTISQALCMKHIHIFSCYDKKYVPYPIHKWSTVTSQCFHMYDEYFFIIIRLGFANYSSYICKQQNVPVFNLWIGGTIRSHKASIIVSTLKFIRWDKQTLFKCWEYWFYNIILEWIPYTLRYLHEDVIWTD